MRALTLFVLFIAGCQTRPILLPGNAPCKNACAVLTFFKCPEAQPSPKGKSCEQVCEVASKYGTQAECVVRAESLEAVRACAVECRQ